jgi:hypothetical protein
MRTTSLKTSLKRLQLPVMSRGGKWHIRFRGKRMQFVDRASAFREAIQQAYQCSKDGNPIQVVSVGADLKMEVVWTYGTDPDPPNGGTKQHGMKKGDLIETGASTRPSGPPEGHLAAIAKLAPKKSQARRRRAAG